MRKAMSISTASLAVMLVASAAVFSSPVSRMNELAASPLHRTDSIQVARRAPTAQTIDLAALPQAGSASGTCPPITERPRPTTPGTIVAANDATNLCQPTPRPGPVVIA